MIEKQDTEEENLYSYENRMFIPQLPDLKNFHPNPENDVSKEKRKVNFEYWRLLLESYVGNKVYWWE